MNGIRIAVFLTAIVCAFPLSARASLIDGFGIEDGPTLLTQSLLVAYDVDSDTLFIRGFNASLDEGNGDRSVEGTGVAVAVDLFFGRGGATLGTFQIAGTILSMGYDSGLLLSGEITNFGFPEFEESGGVDTNILQFAINITGGDAAGLFGNELAFLVNGTGFPGGFGADWVNDGNGSGLAGQLAPVPLPATVWLMLCALAALGKRRLKA